MKLNIAVDKRGSFCEVWGVDSTALEGKVEEIKVENVVIHGRAMSASVYCDWYGYFIPDRGERKFRSNLKYGIWRETRIHLETNEGVKEVFFSKSEAQEYARGCIDEMIATRKDENATLRKVRAAI